MTIRSKILIFFILSLIYIPLKIFIIQLGLHAYKPLIIGYFAIFSLFFVTVYTKAESPGYFMYTISFFFSYSNIINYKYN